MPAKYSIEWITLQAERIERGLEKNMTKEEIWWGKRVVDCRDRRHLMDLARKGDHTAIEFCVDHDLNFDGSRNSWFQTAREQALRKDPAQTREEFQLIRNCIVAEAIYCAKNHAKFDSRAAVEDVRRLYRPAEREKVIDRIISARSEYMAREAVLDFIESKTGWRPTGLISTKDAQDSPYFQKVFR